MYNPYVVGKNIYMRHPTEEDARGNWHQWFSDEETTKNIGDRYWPNSSDAQLNFLKSCEDNRSRLLLSVVDIKSDKHIGVCSLSNISWVHRYCDMALVIGEKDFRSGSIAFEICSLLLKTAFLRLNMKTVRGGYVCTNEYTEKLMKVLRFETVGVYRESFWAEGKYQDYVVTMIRSEDWLKRNALSA
jgi:RimJ/RimL family protein N-acetyltransferase